MLELEAARLIEERNGMQWCVDRFMEIALDMVNNKLIRHDYIIIALGLPVDSVVIGAATFRRDGFAVPEPTTLALLFFVWISYSIWRFGKLPHPQIC